MICAYDGCETGIHCRGLCARHYSHERRAGTLEARPYRVQDGPPLVCLCHHTEAEPGRDFGECPSCRRKPIALLEASVFG